MMGEMRPHLASLIEDWRQNSKDVAVVQHRGNRHFRTQYGELATLAGRFAAELARREIAAGERVLLWGENSAAWIAVFFGCVLRGVIAVPLDAAGSVEFAERVLGEVNPRLVVCDARLPALHRNSGQVATLALQGLEARLPAAPHFEVAPEIGLDAPLQIVFTSGTTSAPKGVVHTHRNVLASVGPIEAEIGCYRRYERPFHPLRFLHTLPLSHVFGQFMGMWLPPLLGAEVHFTDDVEPARLVAMIRRERVSVLVAVPRILELLRAHLLHRFPGLGEELAARQGLSAWQRWWVYRRVHWALGLKFWAMICGGATLPGELERFWNGLGFALIQGYGMTETAALVTLNHPFKVGKGTLGKALPGREVRLTAEGEIEVRGDMLAAGTWREGRFAPRAGEWLATGDLAVQDGSGELRFAGRKGDVIVTAAGMNVHPQDLEAALLAQAGVRGVAVVGCETMRGTEPVAVVLFEGDEQGLRQATEKANAGLAAYQQVRHVLRWPEPAFPYTSTGKLLRRRIQTWASEQVGATAEGEVKREPDALVSLIGRVSGEPVRDVTDDQRLTEDLHLDSLGRVQLQSVLEAELGVEIGDELIGSLRTLGELRQQVWGQPGPFAPLDAASQSASGVGDRSGRGTPPSPREEPSIPGEVTYPRWPWSPPVQLLRSVFLEGLALPLVRLLAAPRVERAVEALPDGPVLLIANHVNTYDVPLVLAALPGAVRRRLAVAMSAEVLAELRAGKNQGSWWRNQLGRPAAWLLVALFNVFPLPRMRGFRRSFAHAGEALDRGYSVLVFPEGRRGKTGVLQPFRPGIGLLVEASQVAVVPVALQGMGSAARGGRWFRSGQVSVRVGAPMRFGAGVSAEEITPALETALRALGPS